VWFIWGLPLALLLGSLLSFSGKNYSEIKKKPEKPAPAEKQKTAGEKPVPAAAAEEKPVPAAAGQAAPEEPEEMEEAEEAEEAAEPEVLEGLEEQTVFRIDEEVLEEKIPEADADLAGGIQKSLLPQRMYHDDNWDISVFHTISGPVSPYFYDYLPAADGSFSGFSFFNLHRKDTAAVLVSALLKSSSQDFCQKDRDLSMSLRDCNRTLLQNSAGNDFYITGAVVRAGKNTLDIAHFGSPPVLYRHAETGRLTQLDFTRKKKGVILGKADTFKRGILTVRLSVKTGDELLFYFPSVWNLMGPDSMDTFGRERWLKSFHGASGKSAEDTRDSIGHALFDYKQGKSLKEDLFFIVLKKR
jgi:serine phosphatase RsbU (regulator of sigma subunit)